MKILVALSGGIDSSVVAHLLAEQGHELIGVRFTLWMDPLAPPLAQVLPSKCCNAQTASRTKHVAQSLGMPLHILDLEEEFKREVVDPFLDAHRRGLTPNPCIGCNRTVKFGRLLELADELGCEKLATGHYARLASETLADGSKRTLLLEATDAAKDQSYYLYGLSQHQLERVCFPLGGLQKHDVFSLAQRFGVPFDVTTYRESQDLCFFPEKSVEPFLQRHLQDAITPGPIIRRDGTVVGTHRGLPLYTVGQRSGLGIGGLSIPLEVVQKNSATNTLVVADRHSERSTDVILDDMRWVSWEPQEDATFDCRVRSLSARLPGRLVREERHHRFIFSTPQPPPAPGQSLVLYRGEEIVGGGVICDTKSPK
jgi:tRNA-specific 2-thiouridylase